MTISINTFPGTTANSAKPLLTFSEQVQTGQGDGCIVAVTSLYTLLIMKTTGFLFVLVFLFVYGGFLLFCFVFTLQIILFKKVNLYSESWIR